MERLLVRIGMELSMVRAMLTSSGERPQDLAPDFWAAYGWTEDEEAEAQVDAAKSARRVGGFFDAMRAQKEAQLRGKGHG